MAIQYNDGNVADTMLRNGNAEEPAILQGKRSVSYGELRSLTECIAAGLLTSSGKGEAVGLLAENGPFCVAAYLGTLRAGRVSVPLPGDISDTLLAYIVESTGMKNVYISRRYLKKYQPILEELGVQPLEEGGFAEGGSSGEMPSIDPGNDLAAIMFTSGSTGTAKGVMVTHRNIECNSLDIIQYMGLTSADRAMVVLPLHYCFGASLLHTHLIAGGSVVLNNNFMYPESVLDDMAATECTGIAGVPSTFQILLRRSTFRQREFPAMRWFQQAGGKLPNAYIQELLESFGHVRYFLMYGQTEATARLSYLPPERLDDKLGSIGKGLPSTKLDVVRQDGVPVEWGSDETGEIVASGDNITKGYWKDETETARFFRDGKLYTGDLARVDEDGFIFVQDRARDFIKTRGKRVGAKELEDVISEIPSVIESAVIGVPHETMGEAIKAYIVVRREAGIVEQDILNHIANRLETYKVPEEVEFIGALPKNSAGKVLKPKLREANHTPG